MDYNETLQYISASPKFSQIPRNENLRKLLAYLGNPQDELSYIHVAGTNGKGSICAMTASVLQNAGFKVGLYTSPFIEVFNERIQINGRNIPDDDLAKTATVVKNAVNTLGTELTEFAQITAIAFLYFKEKSCDFVVLETGLGGRLDATNVIKTPKVCVITKIGLDHTAYLGNTAAEIAAEKCGIIKPKIPVVTVQNQEAEALGVIKDFCSRLKSPLTIAPAECEFETNLAGDYQKTNASAATEICRLLNISEKHIKSGLLNTVWKARFEYLRPNLILDGAHNPDGMSALIKSLKKLNKNIIFVTAFMRDKNYAECASMIDDFSKKIYVCEIPMPRCIPCGELAKKFSNAVIVPDPAEAVKNALLSASSDDIVCVCGSLYLAGHIRKYFKDFTY